MIEKLVPIIYLKDGLGKLGRSDRKHNYENLDSVLAELKSCLPFELTQSQVKAIGEIINDLYSDKNMNRLLEGDVGSGKTVVAMFSLLSAIKNGYQSVLLAPTEILALEHYKLLCKTFENINGVNIAYLSSSLDSKTKRETLTNIENGTANIIVGSHSVFSKSVKYKNLSLVVIDEQHKFGVRARGTLQEKGDNVDTLVMSATPIPRSLKLVFDGVLDISILAARPHKNNVHTNILSMSKVDDMWKYIDTKIQNGSKVFVVCPKIEESDDDTMVSAKEVYEILKDKLHANIELVHGKQDRSETDKLFTGFKSGETNVLVSTSIIEVGVDTKDADIMVIMNASNFGLASLHQLRGRVGRDGRESYCFCVLPENTNVKALDRLKFFKNNTDGFKIAEYDLESRGAGNANGTEQHGLESSDIWGYRVELYELATRIVSYMKNIGVKPNINDQKYAKIIENLVDAVAMN